MGKIQLNKKHHMIIISCLVIFLGVGCMLARKETTNKIVDDFIRAICTNEFEKAYGLLDEASKQAYKKEDFVNRYKNIYSGIEAKNVSFEFKEKTDEGNLYTYHLDTLAGYLQQDLEIKYHKGGVIFDDSYILPNLTRDKKVRVKEYKSARGRILDRNGIELATKGTAYEVGLVKGKLNGDADYSKIASLLDLDDKAIEKALSQSWVKDDSFVPLKKISKDEKSLADDLLKIKGVQLNNVDVRYYPYKNATGHLVGYVSSITQEELDHLQGDYDANSMIGRIGAEASYENELKGENGGKIYLVDKEGKELETILEKEAIIGQDIMLTIDVKLQNQLYEQYKNEPGCSVAQNPLTGEVLALVSTPSYDSNDFVLGMSNKKWEALNNDPTLPLFNRIVNTFSPGSTMKPITAMVALNQQLLDPSKDYQKEMKWQKSKSWGDYFVTTLKGANPNNLKNALVYSDNVYFAKASTRVGAEGFSKGLDDLYFGKQLNFALPLKVSSYQDLDKEIVLADSGYGQGKILMNPLHLTSLYTAFVNEGKVLTPYLKKDQAMPSALIDQAISKENANEILKDLQAVIESESGTGHQAYMPNVLLAGKTGTAEIKASTTDNTGTEIGWFIAFTADKQANKPIILTTMLENVKNQGGSGKVVRGVKETLNFYFSY